MPYVLARRTPTSYRLAPCSDIVRRQVDVVRLRVLTFLGLTVVLPLLRHNADAV